jgi:hypothetical protein
MKGENEKNPIQAQVRKYHNNKTRAGVTRLCTQCGQLGDKWSSLDPGRSQQSEKNAGSSRNNSALITPELLATQQMIQHILFIPVVMSAGSDWEH